MGRVAVKSNPTISPDKSRKQKMALSPRTTRSGRIHQLEMAHQTSIHNTHMISRDEEVRRLKLRELKLKDEICTLKEQLTQKDSHARSIMGDLQALEAELQKTKEDMRKQDIQIKTQARDFTNLETELQSYHSISQDASKILSEKLSLARELNVLKPEVDHLRAQLAHQQTVVAEKLALERQLNSLEVELEAEKRSKQRAQERVDKEEHNKLHAKIQELEKKLATEKKLRQHAQQQEDKDGNELQAKVEELEKELAAERKEKERVRKEGERAEAEATTQQEMMEQRLETMKLKLRETRQELKQCQAELSEARTASIRPTVMEKTMTLPAVRKQQGKHRRVEEVTTTEISIGTPGMDEQKAQRALKKRGLDATLSNFGEKSTFSITPFLNRTKLVDDSLEGVEEEDEEVENSMVGQMPQSAAEVTEQEKEEEEAPVKKARGRPRKILAEVPAAKNATTKRPAAKKGEKGKPGRPNLGKVMEEPAEGGENQADTVAIPPAPASADTEEPANDVGDAPAEEQPNEVKEKKKAPVRRLKADPAPTSRIVAAPSAVELEPKKKKRKLLGGVNRSLFDEDDEDNNNPGGEAEAEVVLKKPAAKVKLGPARGLGKPAAGGVAGLKRAAFAGRTFSPLKKDRRGVGASFLA